MNKIKWRLVSGHFIEVAPAYRESAWKQLITHALSTVSNDGNHTLRTCITKADIKNFNFHNPIYYNIPDKVLMTPSGFFTKALNRPSSKAIMTPPTQLLIAIFFIIGIVMAVILDMRYDR